MIKISKFLVVIALMPILLLMGCKEESYSTAKEYRITNNADAISLCSEIDTLFNSNAYIKIQVGEDSYQYIRLNPKGEAFNSTGLVQLKTNEIVSLNPDDDQVYRTNEGLNITEVQAALKVVDEGKATITKEDNDNIRLYKIRIEGKGNIMDYYRTLTGGDEDFANIAYEVLLQSVKEDGIFLSMLVAVDTNNKDNNGFSARSSFGDKDSDQDDGGYTAWLINGYITTPEWELDSEWYKKDIDSIKFDELLAELNKSTDMDLVLSNNDIFDGYKSNITWAEYEASDNKNALIQQIETDLDSVGITITMGTVALKQKLQDFYSEDVYKDIPILKAAAYICSLEGEAMETEPVTETPTGLSEEELQNIVDSVGSDTNVE